MLDLKPIESLKEPSGLTHYPHLGSSNETGKQVSKPPFLPTSKLENDSEKELTKTKSHSRGFQEEPPFLFAGIALSILGSIIGSVGILCAKLLPDTNFQQTLMTLLIRGIFIIFFSGLTCAIQGTELKIRRDEILVNFLRSAFGTSVVLGTYCAMRYISLGDMTALVFSSPIWTSILSRIILKEPLQWIQILALPSSLLGIVLIAHPALIIDESRLVSPTSSRPLIENLLMITTEPMNASEITSNPIPFVLETTTSSNGSSSSNNNNNNFSQQQLLILNLPAATIEEQGNEHRWLGIVISLATSLLISCCYIVLKFRKKTPIQTTTFWYGICMVVTSLTLFALCTDDYRIPDTLSEWTLYTMIGVCSWLGQCTLQWSFMYETAGVLALCKTLDVAMIFILSAIFLSEDIIWTSILGASIISISVASMMLNTWLLTLPFMSSKQAKKTSSSDDLESTLTISSEIKEKSPTIQHNKGHIYYIQSQNESKKI